MKKIEIPMNKYKVTNEPSENTILPLKDGLECLFFFLIYGESRLIYNGFLTQNRFC